MAASSLSTAAATAPAPAPSPHSWCSTCLIFGAEQTLSGTESAQPQAIPCLTFEAASFFCCAFYSYFYSLVGKAWQLDGRRGWLGIPAAAMFYL